MYVASVTESEHRITIDAMVDLHNSFADDPSFDPRPLLSDVGFSRAPDASAASMNRVGQRMTALGDFLADLPDLDAEDAAARVSEELTELPITPSIVDHGGVGPHIHWTPPTARFDDQMMADVMMALAQEICDNGTIRFGTCAATDCQRLFYDATRNRSKKFCSDSRCASRTHTADHRRRQASEAS
ncbi:CGNR zinc finger domain-containing protein [Ilumatobacter nonamiensis]|uniref:CGNR zinc finger domain-containing protein n=1 Tax=Ilumatobacter nonamiensis TaxID=467093 RepID=UPI000347A4F4|nr:CGNR zinc finger domain-containing protein [Ilumatobacter nonamiensis]